MLAGSVRSDQQDKEEAATGEFGALTGFNPAKQDSQEIYVLSGKTFW